MTTATIRMYRMRNELGDCFLVRLKNGSKTSHLLVDCGSFRNEPASKKRLETIVDDIKKTLGGAPLDVVVGTHQHNDHLSGFVHCEAQFKDIGVSQVWLSWLDDPQNRVARSLGERHRKLRSDLEEAGSGLRKAAISKGLQALERVDDILGFYGAAARGVPAIPALAVEKLRTLGGGRPRYLKPGTMLPVPGLEEDTARIFILGPPLDASLLRRTEPGKGETYEHLRLAQATATSSRLLSAALSRSEEAKTADEREYPFRELDKRPADGSYAKWPDLQALQAEYESTDWRKIDDDWLNEAEHLALYLDTYTNNTSLAFAIELGRDKKVLLFAADAQIGNWQSWVDIEWKDVDLDDLLARTAFYKVGHHGSHNATLPEMLEKMTHPDLVAFIPVHKQDANVKKANGWKMPARNLLRRLGEKTSGRVLQMDGDHGEFDPEDHAEAWTAAGIEPVIRDLYFEVTIRD